MNATPSSSAAGPGPQPTGAAGSLPASARPRRPSLFRALVGFSAGSVLALVLASAGSVYLPAVTGDAARRVGALQVLTGLSVVATLLLLAGFAVALALRRRRAGIRRAAALGAASAAAFVLLLWSAYALGAEPGDSMLLLLALPLLGTASAFLVGRAMPAPTEWAA